MFLSETPQKKNLVRALWLFWVAGEPVPHQKEGENYKSGTAGGWGRTPSPLRAQNSIFLILICAFVSIHVCIVSKFNVTAFMNNPWAFCVYSFIPGRVRFPHLVLFNTPLPLFLFFFSFPSFWSETSLDWTGACGGWVAKGTQSGGARSHWSPRVGQGLPQVGVEGWGWGPA